MPLPPFLRITCFLHDVTALAFHKGKSCLCSVSVCIAFCYCFLSALYWASYRMSEHWTSCLNILLLKLGKNNYWCGRRTRNRNTTWKGLTLGYKKKGSATPRLVIEDQELWKTVHLWRTVGFVVTSCCVFSFRYSDCERHRYVDFHIIDAVRHGHSYSTTQKVLYSQESPYLCRIGDR